MSIQVTSRLRALPWPSLAAVVALACVPQPANAQVPQDEIVYVDADATGSIRLATAANGSVVATHDYQPFGREWPSTAQGSLLFAANERDATGLDYFGARYYGDLDGRFQQADPVALTLDRLLIPQRLNRYSYAANNPLTFGDPNGRDLLIFNYPNGAIGNGHVGIMAFDSSGGGIYGAFNPQTSGAPWSDGRIASWDYPPGTIAVGPNGQVSPTELARIGKDAAKREYLENGHKVNVLHVKTTDAQTVAVANYIAKTRLNPDRYNYLILHHDCVSYCVSALKAGGIGLPDMSILDVQPNQFFTSLYLFSLFDRLWAMQEEVLVPRITITETFEGIKK